MTNPSRYRIERECTWRDRDKQHPADCLVCEGTGTYLTTLDRLLPRELQALRDEIDDLLAAYARIERCRQCGRELEGYFRGPRLCDSCADVLAARLDPIAAAQEEVA